MGSTAATTYQDGIEGKLLTSVGTGTTTGVTFKIKQINGTTPTAPSAAFRLHVLQRTATVSKHEVWGVAAGTTQSGQTVTLGTLTRGLPLSDGTDFTGSGTPQSFAAGADVFLSWDAHDAAKSAKVDLANTFTDHQTLATTKELRLGGTSRAIYDDGTEIYLKSGTTAATSLAALAAGGGTDHKVLNTSNDSTAGYLFNKLAAGAGITLTETNDGGDEDTTIAAVNTVATGHTGLATIPTGSVLIGAGTSNMTTTGPGTNNQVLKSNGTTFAVGNVPTYFMPVFTSGTTSATLTNPTSATVFDTYTYTIPANDLVAGVEYKFRISIEVNMGTSGDTTAFLFLGSTQMTAVTLTTPSTGTQIFEGSIMGTTTAAAAASVKSSSNAMQGSKVGTNYVAANNATDGTLAITFKFLFGTSNGSNIAAITHGSIYRGFTTAA